MRSEVEIEWFSEYNPFNSMKVMAWADHIRGIIDEELLPPVVVNWDLRRERECLRMNK